MAKFDDSSGNSIPEAPSLARAERGHDRDERTLPSARKQSRPPRAYLTRPDPIQRSGQPSKEWPPVKTQSISVMFNDSVFSLHEMKHDNHNPKNGTGKRNACCSYKLAIPFQLVNCVKYTINT
jgi:hypothetical protein